MNKPALRFAVFFFLVSILGFTARCSAQHWGGYLGTGVFVRAIGSEEEPELMKALVPSGRPMLSANLFRQNIENENIFQFGFFQFGFHCYLPVQKKHNLALEPYQNGLPRVNNCKITTYGFMGDLRFSLISPPLTNPLYKLYIGPCYGGGVAFTMVSDTLHSDGLVNSRIMPGKHHNAVATGSIFVALVYETEKFSYQFIADAGQVGTSLDDVPMLGVNLRFGLMFPFRKED